MEYKAIIGEYLVSFDYFKSETHEFKSRSLVITVKDGDSHAKTIFSTIWEHLTNNGLDLESDKDYFSITFCQDMP